MTWNGEVGGVSFGLRHFGSFLNTVIWCCGQKWIVRKTQKKCHVIALLYSSWSSKWVFFHRCTWKWVVKNLFSKQNSFCSQHSVVAYHWKADLQFSPFFPSLMKYFSSIATLMKMKQTVMFFVKTKMSKNIFLSSLWFCLWRLRDMCRSAQCLKNA